MQNIQLFAEIQGGTGQYFSYREIDLYDAEPIKFTRSIQQLEDPQATTSDFSRTFRVPGNSNNGRYFEAAFNVNATDYNPTLKAAAYINIDGAFFISGNIRLTGVYTNPKNSKIEYEIVFMGETSTFASEVAPKNMSDLDFSDLGHFFTYNNVVLSWDVQPGGTGGLLNGDIVYPLCEWGYGYSGGIPIENTLSFYTGTTAGSIKGFTNSAHPLTITQFKPAIRAKKIWDRIFESAGFDYSSNFLDSMFFQQLYMISTDQSTSYSTLANIAFTEVGINYSGPPPFPLNQNVKISRMTEFVDNNNSFNPVTCEYRVQTTGFHQIRGQLTIQYTPTAVPATTKTFSFSMRVNQSYYINRPAYLPYTQGGRADTSAAFSELPPSQNKIFDFSGNYQAGDVLTFYLYVPASQFIRLLISEGTLTFDGPDILEPSGLMPTQYKQIDFIKAINDRFKLMWEPDPMNPRTFRIEPWVDWIRGGTLRDWSDKLDESKDVSTKPLFYTQPRKIIFKDSEESDLYNFSYQQTNKQTFGQLIQDSEIELITGERTISSLFAPVPLAPIGNASNFLIPHFAKDTESQRQPIQVKPRLVFYNGLVTAPYTWYLKNDGGTSVAQTRYPLISQFNSYPFNQLSYDLNWTNVPQFWLADQNNGITGRTTQTTFTNYWQEWFNTTYNPYSRTMEGNFTLDSVDLQELRFNDLVFVKDSWWFPVEIKDYALGTRQTVKVNLVKLATDFSFGGSGGTGGTGPVIFGRTANLYQFPDLCYGETQCDAICCRGIDRVNVFAYESDLNQVSVLYSNPSGTITGPSGWYFDGTQAIEINEFGVYVTGATSGSCNCTSSLNAFAVTASEDSCTGCCSTTYNLTVYGNGGSLPTSSVIWADSSGTVPLTGGFFYKNADGQVQLASNGFTVTNYIGCTGNSGGGTGGCNCLALEFFSTYAFGNSDGVVFVTPSDACNNVTREQYTTVYTTTDGLTDVTAFYFDVNREFPIGPSGATGFISDGNIVVFYEGATGVSADKCSQYSEQARPILTPSTFTSLLTTNLDITVKFYTSPQPGTLFLLDEENYGGTGFSNSNAIDYNSDYYIAFGITGSTGCRVISEYYQNDILVDYQNQILTGSGSLFIQTPAPIGNNAIDFHFYFDEI